MDADIIHHRSLNCLRKLRIRKEKLDIASKAVIECMADVKGKNEKDFEKIFLDAHMEIIRYKTVCDN